jgi:hypothetical protein
MDRADPYRSFAVPTLNESLTFADATRTYNGLADTFVNGTASRTLLPAGFGLFKFSGYGVIGTRAGAGFSPWWTGVETIPGTDHPGLDGVLAQARQSGMPTVEFARKYYAVKSEWNALGIGQLGMAKILRGHLTQPVYGFVGRCQRMNDEKGPVIQDQHKMHVLAGGAWQIYIPNLTADFFSPTGMYLVP